MVLERCGDAAVLKGRYALGDEVGSGGFGKVKLATHCLSGDKVAVKIIDKKAIGDDLPRVTTELRALRTLTHQNICRLYESIETDAKFYIVLEYCSGGELFDYIVKKECLPEPEARHFFRQIVAAIAYVHSMGFAHRDLKPENLLLTDDLQLKLIDFGLCANPESGLGNRLETCCGSPAYAAPELISGQAYFGNEADIWSLGVLLYALLCGCLPFEDDNLTVLYRKIADGRYAEPAWLSSGSRSLLKSMLQTDPRRRIAIQELITHPWLLQNYSQPLKWRSVYDSSLVDEECVAEVARYHGCGSAEMATRLKQWKFDYTTATYLLLLNRKRRRQPVVLPNRRVNASQLLAQAASNPTATLLSSPTIHSSLESGLDRSGRDDSNDDDDEPFNMAFVVDDLARYASNAMVSFVPVYSCLTAPLPQTSYACAIGSSPRRSPSASCRAADKENDETPLRGRRGKVLDVGSQRQMRVRSVYASANGNAPVTPARRPLTDAMDNWLTDTPLGAHLRAKSTERGGGDSTTSTPRSGRSSAVDADSPAADGSGRTPRSRQKTPRLTRRMFASVERKAQRVITLLTPRRTGRPDAPLSMKRTQTLVNVSTAATNDGNLVLDQLKGVFEAKGIVCEQRGWKLAGKAKDRQGRRCLTFELEVVYIEHLDKVGVRRKRLNGDAFMYKRCMEDILKLASL